MNQPNLFLGKKERLKQENEKSQKRLEAKDHNSFSILSTNCRAISLTS